MACHNTAKIVVLQWNKIAFLRCAGYRRLKKTVLIALVRALSTTQTTQLAFFINL